ncbi:MAG: molybdopterin oxidoreductase family protein [Hoeflea sp.]|uniref:molybdopterin-containing oxidoreductase family protein n=1 Tax=Hoeflea sp. TaxID=1940281 RepID=UPI001DE04CAB|nr:molybdopterin oxidoreductase family protein [Hoeflea sp.]MBU4530079.1 molybdopterin oxidoreductase family protein [Alphaproteobacteria bacterium]MBU4542636.1 molybdopterin oxidoreductase family protein [Alphaproteobacteria bacterium]MBU4551317.1 molybdopterin oxidoreductase family protein [Alphaproteobacteria bacterium]MBV1723140.1 molybdopterin oxidoreductase family protein [Hoeflea sp.]MBV1760151.1 molybdopterin oxidoreductase family protein [Hoeflea sp.]
MNDATPLKSGSLSSGAATVIGHSACPHDCPSTCALEVEILADNRIGRVRGDAANSYTAGVICAKVARYAERIHHPGRLLKPLIRAGAKGEGQWKEASFGAALDLIAEKFDRAEAAHGSETVWLNHYAGTMGLVQRDGIHRLRHAKRYSNQFDSFCTNLAWTGFAMGAGALRGPDPREMAKSDCVVIWGTNAVSTQVNVMTHAIRARKERGAKIAVIDIYDTPTMKQADIKILLKPGTDGAFACAVMHVLFREGLADRDYLDKYSDDPAGLEKHLRDRTPTWAEAISGVPAAEIEAFARLVGATKRTFFRLGYGFTRQRNGAANMHAALSLAVVTGCYQYEGGGAFHSNSDIFRLDKSLLEGRRHYDPGLRWLDQSRIGRVLTGEAEALNGGPPVTAMLVQNTNPANVAPEQRKVVEGLKREDLFVAVHEQFMTDTAKLADVVLPATMFLEHDDIYRGGGHQHIMLGPKLVDPPEGPMPNHHVFEELGRRLGVSECDGFGLTERQHIDHMLQKRGLGDFDSFREEKWADMQPDFETAHFLNGFAHKDGKFRFRPDWTGTPAANRPPRRMGPQGPVEQLPEFPDHVDLIESADADHPFRLATSPSRSFLNSTFAETASSQAKEVRPDLMMHPDDAEALGIAEGDRVRLGNPRGEVSMHARLDAGQRRGVVIHEGLWPNSAFEDGEGINTLTGADSCAPYGGAAFHDTRVWVRRT